MIKTKQQYESSQQVTKKNLNNYELAQLSKRVINATLKDRIPNIQQSYLTMILMLYLR